MKLTTLRSQFIWRIFTVMLIIAILTGLIQMWLMSNKIDQDINSQALMMSNSIQQGINETNLASSSIEHQIDLKLKSYGEEIANVLKGKTIDQIKNEDLVRIRDQEGLAGITLFVRTQDDIVGVRATDPSEIGFGIKKVSPYGFQEMDEFMKGNNVPSAEQQQMSYYTDTFQSLFITRSTSNSKTPEFFKYGYFRQPGVDYLIDPYIQADEIYKFTQNVGPDSWIHQVQTNNPNTLEIAVLDPRVFANPSLASTVYPPLTQITHGTYDLKDNRDTAILTNMVKSPKRTSYIGSVNGKTVDKIFIPIGEDRVLYIALDYNKMAWPYYRYTIIVIISGFIALIALFVMAARFFNRVYQNIQKINKQMGLLKSGDFTAKSEILANNELGSLSESANGMTETLRNLLLDTSEHAAKVQRLSALLEDEANQSVKHMSTVSTETTIQQREAVDYILDFIDRLEKVLGETEQNEETVYIIENLENMRELAKDRATSTTDLTIRLTDLLASLYEQSHEMAEISDSLIGKINLFKLS